MDELEFNWKDYETGEKYRRYIDGIDAGSNPDHLIPLTDGQSRRRAHWRHANNIRKQHEQEEFDSLFDGADDVDSLFEEE